MSETATADDTTIITAPLSVHEAWANVMSDLNALGKDQRNAQQGFNFRGVDDVMNAVGPVLRKHRVLVIPTHVETSHRDVLTANGRPQREATVSVEYTIYGPDGSSLPGAAAGESADSGDKGTPKAMSVAYRTFLLQALCLPTHQEDPDQHIMERGTGPSTEQQQQAQALADTALQAKDSAVILALREEAERHRVLDVPVLVNGRSGPLGLYLQARHDWFVSQAQETPPESPEPPADEWTQPDLATVPSPAPDVAASAEPPDSPPDVAHSAAAEQSASATPAVNPLLASFAFAEAPEGEKPADRNARYRDDEIRFQAAVCGLGVEEYRTSGFSKPLDQMRAPEVHRAVVGARESIADSMREQGWHAEADAYAVKAYPLNLATLFSKARGEAA